MASVSEESALVSLHKRFPCRDEEISKLWRLVHNNWGPIPHTLIYGVSGVGKTVIVRAVIEASQVRHAYVCCTHACKPQQVQQSVISQLKSTRRTRDNSYTAGVHVEHTADFIQQLGELCPLGSPPAVIIIDRAENAVSSSWLPALLRARELCDERVNISVILVSTHAWGSGTFVPYGRLYPVHMKAYTQEQLGTILLTLADLHQSDVPLYSIFVQNVIISTFGRLTRHCQDLHQLALALYPHYKQPLVKNQVPSDLPLDVIHRRLYSNQHFQQLLMGTMQLYQPGCPVHAKPQQADKSKLDFELSLLGKWLLLAAYIASRNKPTLDRQVFDGSARSGKIRGKGGRALDLQADAAAEAAIKGPHWFPLRRLMLIHDALLRSCGVTGSQDMTEEDDDSLSLATAATLASLKMSQLGLRRAAGSGVGQSRPSSSSPAGRSRGGASMPPPFSPKGKRFRTTNALPIPDDDTPPSTPDLNADQNHPSATRRRSSSRPAAHGREGDEPWKPKGLDLQEESTDILRNGDCSFCHQLSSLVNLKFLSQGAEDVLEGPRYYCNISDNVATQIAQILGVDLSKYIRYQ